MKHGIIRSNINTLKHLVAACIFLLNTGAVSAQFEVTEVITDYGGYWKSAASNINHTKPDNSHNLLAFSFNGTRYATGVNNAALSGAGQSFVPGDYRALPITSIGSAVTTNTKIGLGYMQDGVANGPSVPAPVNNIPYYLTDGVKGLNLGTCVANLPAGTMFFPVNKVLKASIGDGAPDMVVTQIADPSGSMDRYQFTDVNGNIVGNYVDIRLNNIAPVGNWTADFYEASQNPMSLQGGYTKTDRPVRLWASDLSAFGIDSNNAARVAYFKIILSGNSDIAFVAYNNNSINLLGSLLPVKLNNFSGKDLNSQVQLNWQTATEVNSDAFTVEKSADGLNFTTVITISATGNTNTSVNYSCYDKQPFEGKNYYRLKMMDKDGHADYSNIITITSAGVAVNSMRLYPNPARTAVTINHPFAGNNEQVQLINAKGTVLLQQKLSAASFQTRLDLSALSKGMYELVWSNGKDLITNHLVIL